MAGVLAGIMILLLGVFNLGQIVNFIPSAVIAGFTSGIAVDHLSSGRSTTCSASIPQPRKTRWSSWSIISASTTRQIWRRSGLSLLVILIMVFWPKRLNARFPGSLLALIVATAVAVLFNLDVPIIGSIPQTILLDQRLLPAQHPLGASRRVDHARALDCGAGRD